MNKVVMVTGATGGIGYFICKIFKLNNFSVVGIGLEKEYDNTYIDDYIYADLSNKNNHENIIKTIKEKYNRLDCIINNAAVQICKSIWETSNNDWDLIMDCNVRSVFLFAKYGIDMLKESRGNIINIGSVHSICTSNKIAIYATSKAAIVGLTKNLAIELGQFGIRVNCISPGAVDTNMLRNGLMRGHIGNRLCDELVNNLSNNHLLGKIGNPEEIANFIWFVASDQCNFINGSNLIVDGGACIRLSTEVNNISSKL